MSFRSMPRSRQVDKYFFFSAQEHDLSKVCEAMRQFRTDSREYECSVKIGYDKSTCRPIFHFGGHTLHSGPFDDEVSKYIVFQFPQELCEKYQEFLSIGPFARYFAYPPGEDGDQYDYMHLFNDKITK